jgi:hypothetical protein
MTIVAVTDVSVEASQLRPGPLTPGGCLCLRDGVGCGGVCDALVGGRASLRHGAGRACHHADGARPPAREQRGRTPEQTGDGALPARVRGVGLGELLSLLRHTVGVMA